jgi:hypothetical protein
MHMKLQTKYETRAPADIIVYAADRYPVLAVEIKETRQASAEKAAAVRRNLLAHRLLSDSAFFLLVYPTMLFLWRRETPASGLPDYIASATPVLNDTELKVAGDDGVHLRKGGLQLRVFAWLSVLASDLRSADPKSEPEKMLIDSGVYAQLRHGDVRFEADP